MPAYLKHDAFKNSQVQSLKHQKKKNQTYRTPDIQTAALRLSQRLIPLAVSVGLIDSSLPSCSRHTGTPDNSLLLLHIHKFSFLFGNKI